MKLSDLVSGVEVIEFRAEPDMDILDICYDSRTAKPGELFVAVKGFETDGHKYIRAAAEKGASAVICEEVPDFDIPYVLVKDSRLALALASKNFFGDPASRMTLIGVTGTNGKTTVTTLIKKMLEDCKQFSVGLVGTNQNMIRYQVLETERTTPESYDLQKLLRQMADAGVTHVVMEISSHSIVLSRVAGITFEIGIFTNLTQDHLDFHRDMDDYANVKASFFEQCRNAAVNLDDNYAELMMERAQGEIITYSAVSNVAELVAKDIKLSPQGVKFCALSLGNLERVSIGIPGRFTIYNGLAVLACGMLLGISCAEAAESLKSSHGVPGRMEAVPTDGDYTIIIDYAHTPDALQNVLKSVREVCSGRLVVLFGCGGDRDRTKRPEMGRIAEELADFVILTSDNPRTEEPMAIIEDIRAGMEGKKSSYIVIEDRHEAIAYAIERHMPGDTVILAGKGHETYQIVGKTKNHMDEREIVAEIIARRTLSS